MEVKLSIIIPCFNTEKTLEETLQSVYNQYFINWEAIIINDGSPDNLETIALKWVQKDSRFKYFKKENGGLATARNFGIENAVGEFILPLDSDNKIRANFATNALELFDSNKEISVVYGNAMYFGEKSGIWYVGSFDKYKMLIHNYIDACTIIKKSVFEEAGLYDQEMPYQGHEDWEFWLRLLEVKKQFKFLDEITFDYRVTSNSMIRSFNENMISENISYIKRKHFILYVNYFEELYVKYLNGNKELDKIKSRNYKKTNKIKLFIKKIKNRIR